MLVTVSIFFPSLFGTNFTIQSQETVIRGRFIEEFRESVSGPSVIMCNSMVYHLSFVNGALLNLNKRTSCSCRGINVTYYEAWL